MDITEEEYLAHYGTPRHSGRYPWGSGGEEGSNQQRNMSFLDHVASMRKEGLSETQIAEGLGMTTSQLRAKKSIAKNEKKQADIAMAQRLKDKGYSNGAIGLRMELNESSVRSLLAPGLTDKLALLQATSNMLKDQVAKKLYIDVGTGVEGQIGMSRTKLDNAIALLKEKGYVVQRIQIDQLGTTNKTTIKVLAAPGTVYADIAKNKHNIKQITDFTEDGGRSFLGLLPPLNVNSKRIEVKYAEDGGIDVDGMIYIRPGVKDLSIGLARYAQVRVSVDGTHYLKGMAVYKDDLPAGTDLVFNTSKSNTGTKSDAMKELKRTKEGDVDLDNPFGATVRQIFDKDSDGKGRLTSAMNLVNEEGDWDKWSRNLSSQTLSKQSPTLAKSQLDMTHEKKVRDLDDILSLTNPAVRKKLLESFADDADSSSVHLKAAALPRSNWQVLLPINSLKPNEIYAPNYRNGEQVALIRYPHGGTFEIPELVVNNNHRQAKALIGRAKDAVGINSTVAKRLSGADFDGDAVLVIPNGGGKVKTSPALAELKGFDPQAAYPQYPGMPRMTAQVKATQMGNVSNLITDMTIRLAPPAELARAVRHSMVVIDAEKHNLNYKQSAVDNGIAQLKAKYQEGSRSGAATLISRATAEIRVPERKLRPASKGGPVDKATGKKVYEESGVSYVNAKGKTVVKKIKSQKLAETDDARTLSSGTPIERIYADHSNRLKALANQARKEAVNTRTTPYSPSAKTAYAKEVASLNASLNVAIKNRPLERQAQVVANAVYQAKRQANPDLDRDQLKRIKFQALSEARTRTGAQRQQIELSDKEWDAIQAGAITNHKLSQILNSANLTRVKQLATPKTAILMTSAKQRRAEAMIRSGYTQAEIADALGVSLTTLKTSLGGEG